MTRYEINLWVDEARKAKNLAYSSVVIQMGEQLLKALDVAEFYADPGKTLKEKGNLGKRAEEFLKQAGVKK